MDVPSRRLDGPRSRCALKLRSRGRAYGGDGLQNYSNRKIKKGDLVLIRAPPNVRASPMLMNIVQDQDNKIARVIEVYINKYNHHLVEDELDGCIHAVHPTWIRTITIEEAMIAVL